MPDFDDEVTELETEVRTQQDNQTKAFERLTKERDKLREKLAQFEAAEAARRRAEAFSELQIDKKFADLYNGEDDPDAIRDWATKYGFMSQPAESDDTPDAPTSPSPTLPSSGMQPVVGGSQPAERFLTDIAEVEKLARENPSELQRLYSAGRVKLEKIEGGFRGTVPSS